MGSEKVLSAVIDRKQTTQDYRNISLRVENLTLF